MRPEEFIMKQINKLNKKPAGFPAVFAFLTLALVIMNFNACDDGGGSNGIASVRQAAKDAAAAVENAGTAADLQAALETVPGVTVPSGFTEAVTAGNFETVQNALKTCLEAIAGAITVADMDTAINALNGYLAGLTGNGTPDTPETPTDITDFDFEQEALVSGTDALNTGEKAGIFGNVKGGSGSYTYTLISGEGSTNNANFKVSGNTLIIQKLKLSAASSPYSVRVKIKDNGGTKSELPKQFTITVIKTPASFRNAPVLTPYIASGTSNKITASWEACKGATDYDLYYNISNDTGSAVKLADVTSPADIGKLPDGTKYYVWVKAKNSEGETDFSPAASAKTNSPPQPLWYSDSENGHKLLRWDSDTDQYNILKESSQWYLAYNLFVTGDPLGTWSIGECGRGYQHLGAIRHHEIFDNEDVEVLWPGAYTENADAGVFIIEDVDSATKEPKGVFRAAYYFLFGATETASGPHNGMKKAVMGDAFNLMSVDILNQYPEAKDWPSAGSTGPAFETFEEAHKAFTLAYHTVWFHTAIPQYPVYDNMHHEITEGCPHRTE